MTLIKKQNKDKEAPGSEKKEQERKVDADPENPEDVKPEAEKDPANENVENNAEGGTAEGEKEISEADFLKAYLKKSLEELKKQKEENESLKKQLEQVDVQILQCKEKFDSMVAEYENYRRRTTLEKQNLGVESTSKAVTTLLPALDNLERAMPFADSEPESFKKGVEMTLRQLTDAFKSLGVEEIEAKDEVFDPELHDAVMHVEDESLGESIVTDVFQKGYRIGDKVVRHSVVKVAN
jgi:molecular chaperone GrpE